MKWFKHDSYFRNHEDIDSFLDVGTGKERFERYGLLISIFEAVSEQMDWEGEPTLKLSLRGWARVLGCHQNLLRAYLGNPEIGVGHLRDCPMIQVTFVGDRCQIRIEYLRTCIDETTRKEGKKRASTPGGNSGATPAREEEEEENRRDQIKTDSLSSSSSKKKPTTTLSTSEDLEIEKRVRTLVEDWNAMAGQVGLQTVDQNLLPTDALGCAHQRVIDAKWWENYTQALDLIPRKPYLLYGDPISDKYRNFRANFPWFVLPDRVAKILSGDYGKVLDDGMSVNDDNDI